MRFTCKHHEMTVSLPGVEGVMTSLKHDNGTDQGCNGSNEGPNIPVNEQDNHLIFNLIISTGCNIPTHLPVRQ